jgi:hypothetical protein
VVSAQIRAEGGPRPASLSLLGPMGPPGKPDGYPRGSSANVKHKRLIRHHACELCANYRTLPLVGLEIAATSIDHEGEKEEEAWLRVRREAENLELFASDRVKVDPPQYARGLRSPPPYSAAPAMKREAEEDWGAERWHRSRLSATEICSSSKRSSGHLDFRW